MMASIASDMAVRHSPGLHSTFPSLDRTVGFKYGETLSGGIIGEPALEVVEVDSDEGEPPTHDNCDDSHGDKMKSITLSSSSKTASQAIAPFLAKHIPEQYAAQGTLNSIASPQKNPNTKYCYRHHPDLKCRRTADEPTMEILQNDLETLDDADQQAITHVWSLFSASPAKHRNLMLQGILTQCCFPQLSYLSGAVRDLIRIDFISALPAEISFKVLCYLDTASLCKAAQVSRRWRQLADDDVVWHKMCEQHIDKKCVKCGWGLPLLERKRLRDWKRQQQLRATGRGLNDWSPVLTPLADPLPELPSENVVVVTSRGAKRSFDSLNPGSPDLSKRQCGGGVNSSDEGYFAQQGSEELNTRPWKFVYRDRYKVSRNWKHGRYNLKTFKAHTNGIMSLQFDDRILVTGSYDRSIKIWNVETGELLRTLRGHTAGVRTLQFDDQKLISGSEDGTMRIWNWRTGDILSLHSIHDLGINTLHFDGNLVATGSKDKTIKITNFSDKSRFTLRGHTEMVNNVKLHIASRTVLSASDDNTVKLWDLDTRECIRTFEGHVACVQQVLALPEDYEPEEAIYDEPSDDAPSPASYGSAHDQSAADFRSTLGPGYKSCTAASATRPLPPRFILSGSLDATIRLWDVHTGKCIKKFFGHVEGVWALAADKLRVVSGAEDRMVKIWDSKTGKCERTFTGHMGPVSCIGLSDDRIITGNLDSEIKIYSFLGDPSTGDASSVTSSIDD